VKEMHAGYPEYTMRQPSGGMRQPSGCRRPIAAKRRLYANQACVQIQSSRMVGRYPPDVASPRCDAASTECAAGRTAPRYGPAGLTGIVKLATSPHDRSLRLPLKRTIGSCRQRRDMRGSRGCAESTKRYSFKMIAGDSQ
jgi:hypothetical protein